MICQEWFLDGEMIKSTGWKVQKCLRHYYMQMGTPYIYQGEEIGMTNVKFEILVIIRHRKFNMYKREKKKKDIVMKK